jgi:hypothetical protein
VALEFWATEMARLQNNLDTAVEELRQHRQVHNGCGNRYVAGEATAKLLAAALPLSHSRSEKQFEKIWSDRTIKSRRLLNGGTVPKNADGSNPAEVVLGTDDDVFLYAGPIRFPTSNCCGILFAPAIEPVFPRDKRATPFDSGGLVAHFTQKVPATSAKDFLEAHELPVPDYRKYLSDFTASLFDPPSQYYLATDPPLCEQPIAITGGDVRRATFEVRFRNQVPLDAYVLAIFLASVVAQEPWAKAIMVECVQRGITVRTFSTDDNLAYDHLVQATVFFIGELLK